MNKLYTDHIAGQLEVAAWQVEHCIELFEEGATVPFISRYRKERTGALDEMQVAAVRHYWLRFTELEKRKAAILSSIEEQGKLTDDLRRAIENEVDAQTVEDLYLPYRPKRRTRASVAREKGYEPLALKLWNMELDHPERESEEALAGARDIIAEMVAESQPVRAQLRDLYTRWGSITSHVARGKADDADAQNYQNYFDFSQRLDRIPSHRLLAMLRARAQGFVSVKVDVNPDHALERIDRKVYEKKRRPTPACRAQVDAAVEDAYKRLLHPSIENEVIAQAKEKADVEAIRVFGENLRELLLAPPVGQKRTLAIDPGFRTGCKVVCLDAQGTLLHNDTIYPHPPVNEKIAAMKKISAMVEAYKIEVIAIGNGTAGRETEAFIQKIALPEGVRVYSVSEDGASVYSASEVAREEFPGYDVTVRGAVSIGRRLMDPLAELVKIDPKSIGVGQYQHDVDQTLLKERLDETVESCVNRVGVNLNTASSWLLRYVSGIGPVLARSIVDYRTENGPFASRDTLLKVKRLGPKVYEQCAGFLRIPGAANPLDNTAVHPERYALVERMAADAGVAVSTFIADASLREKVDLKRYVAGDAGMPTLTDIMTELAKPGRDPRGAIRVFEFSQEIQSIEDVQVGMVLPCIVTNVTAFGAFVDIGIHEHGLIHVSQMGDKYVSDPSKVLKVHQQLEARVISVDLDRRRIGLSLKGLKR
ncbi:MAG: RNA-binding transcriptional accessory protein [Bacteroidales bacterium]|nr:RNA-binding transcriptional accessory protein [Bacteroidales bacterium]MBQ2599264.1 RNA-binding transcriptional accessory protein [Bacteroidales bacterium]